MTADDFNCKAWVLCEQGCMVRATLPTVEVEAAAAVAQNVT